MENTEPKIYSLIRRASRAYTAGPGIHDARSVCEDLAIEGIASTVCYWNRREELAQQVAGSYLDLLGVVSSLNDCYLSIKAPALQFDFDELTNILDRAARTNATVHFDSMSQDEADQTFDMIRHARNLYSRIGCTLPSRWRRSLNDAHRAVELDLRVRVVKGEWAGINGEEVNPRQGFLNIIDRLRAEGARSVAVATHDVKLAREALRRLRTTGISCELELLYGLPLHPLLKVAQDAGVPARIYVPCGYSGLPYRLKSAWHNPWVLGWFVRDLLRGGQGLKPTTSGLFARFKAHSSRGL